MHDFDEVIDRKNSDCYKWARYKGRDINPHWVADMDFKAPPAVIDSLHKRVEHGVYGYAVASEEHYAVIQAYLKESYGWSLSAESIIWLPGLVCGFNAACRAVAAEQERVMTLTPIYPPFLKAPRNFNQKLCKVPMIDTGTAWEIDFAAIEEEFKQGVSLFLMCNPHNPVGRVYTREELVKLSDLCLKYDVTVSSDEIHCDLILGDDQQHIPTATISSAIANKCMTFMAPSKIYNLPGLACCFAIIEEKGLRRKFKNALSGIVPDPNILGLDAALVAYRDCAEWKADLLRYLTRNRDDLQKAVAAMPGVNMYRVEGTYLAWLDVRALNLADPIAHFEKAGVGLSNGADFDAPGFVRFNFACTHALMMESLKRMADSLPVLP